MIHLVSCHFANAIPQGNASCDVFGKAAVVTKQKGSLLTIEIPLFAKSGELMPPRRYDCNVNDVADITGKEIQPFDMKNMTKLTGGEKRFMIKQIWGNSMTYPSIAANGMLADSDLRAYQEYLQWQYQAQEVRMADPNVVKLLTTEGSSTEEGLMSMFQIRDDLTQALHLVIPIHSDNPLHWTFIVLRTAKQGDLAITGVEYVDWLHGIKSNRDAADYVFQLISEGSMGPLPNHRNYYRQKAGSNDCGLAGLLELENLMKECRGEGRNMLYPDPSKMRTKMNTILRVLHKEGTDWLLEDASEKKQKVIIQIPGSVIEDKKAYADKVKKAHADGSIITKVEKFYICVTCRWTASGAGCMYCNPAKSDANKKK